MPEQTYAHALAEARRERDDLRKQAQDLSQRLARLETTIAALATLCGEPAPAASGFTDAVRLVLKRAYPTGLIPTTVRRLLLESGFPLADYGNPGASIHTILKRLEKSGEVRRGTRPSDHAVFYTWIGKDHAKPPK